MNSNEPQDAVVLPASMDTVRFIIDKAHAFQMLGDSPSDDAAEGPDPAYAELMATVEDLEPDQQVGLVALMWLGRGDYTLEDWQQALSDAGDSWTERTAEYLIETPLLADYLAEGLERLGFLPG
jgi:hypothetical protein